MGGWWQKEGKGRGGWIKAQYWTNKIITFTLSLTIMFSEDTKKIPKKLDQEGAAWPLFAQRGLPSTKHQVPRRGAPDRYCADRGTLFTHLRPTAIFHCSTPHRRDVSITTTADDPFSKRHRKENYLIVIKIVLNAFTFTSVMQLFEMFTVTTQRVSR